MPALFNARTHRRTVRHTHSVCPRMVGTDMTHLDYILWRRRRLRLRELALARHFSRTAALRDDWLWRMIPEESPRTRLCRPHDCRQRPQAVAALVPAASDVRSWSSSISVPGVPHPPPRRTPLLQRYSSAHPSAPPGRSVKPRFAFERRCHACVAGRGGPVPSWMMGHPTGPTSPHGAVSTRSNVCI